MINVNDEVNAPDIDLQQLENDAQRIMTLMGYADFDLSLLLTDNQTIQHYNRDFRHKDVPTDILSFPFHPHIKGGELIQADTDDDKNLGDLIISVEYIRPIYEEENKTANEYLKILLSHGICHLLGYDHYTEETDKVMKEKEKWLATSLAKE